MESSESREITSGRFAAVLKQSRLKKRWKQEELAEALHVKLRTVVSWETGTRLPSIGTVFLLCTLFLEDNEQRSIIAVVQHDLFLSYLADDLHHQTQIHNDQAFRELVEQRMQLLVQNPIEEQQPVVVPEFLPSHIKEQSTAYTSSFSQQHQEGILDALFAVMERLRAHPDLIPIVHDFLNEVGSPKSF